MLLCRLWESLSAPTDRPALTAGSGATSWKVSSSRWKMIAQTLLSLQLSAYKDATPAPQWHFLPHCAEGRGFYLSAELRSFQLCAAGYSLRWSGRERAWLTICSEETHTHTGRINIHLSQFHHMWSGRKNMCRLQKDKEGRSKTSWKATNQSEKRHRSRTLKHFLYNTVGPCGSTLFCNASDLHSSINSQQTEIPDGTKTSTEN